MKIVVGLGNPGREYEGSRHNIGFEVISELVRRHAPGVRPKAKFDGEYLDFLQGEEKIVLLCPLTFMNLSGRSVLAAMRFFKVDQKDLLVICDDLNLPVGELRFRPGGSSGGQNGLKDIIEKLGGNDFSRLRVGIGHPPPRWDASKYVLGKFSPEDCQEFKYLIPTACKGVECWIENGIDSAMNRYNGASIRESMEKPVD